MATIETINKMTDQIVKTMPHDGAAETITRDDVEYLVRKCYDMIDNNVSPSDAARLTYGCLYRQSDIRYNPRARIDELKK